MTRAKLGILRETFICQVPELEKLNLGTTITKRELVIHINDQFLEIVGPYGTDFCTPKFVFGNKVLGTWDGRKLTREEKKEQILPVFDFLIADYGYRELTRASFIHDVLCYFLEDIAMVAGEREKEIRYLADCVFHREGIDFRWIEIYYKVLRVYGRLKYGKR